MTPVRHRARQGGHTLVELVVVTTLMAMLTLLIAQAWKPIGRSTAALRKEAVGLTELRLALAYLRQDLGGAIRLEARDGGLHVEREPRALARWGKGRPDRDPGVDYRLRDGTLLRADHFTGHQFAVARDLAAWEVSRASAGATRIVARPLDDPEHRALEVVWSR